ncbi:putative reverse transcriptase domain-containing protein [Tanacetum coccineum]
MDTPTLVCVWSCPNFSAPAGRPFRSVKSKDNVAKDEDRSAGRPAAESLGGETGVQVGRGGWGRRPREGNDERVDELNGQGNDQGLGANGGVEGVNENVEGANEGAPGFSTIIAQQLQNLLPAMLAQVSNRGNVGNQNGNVVNENVQENVGNVIVNGNRVGYSYKEFLACNPKEYDGKGGAVVLTRWIEKMEFMHDMSGCSIDQKVKYTAGSFLGKSLTWWNSQICTLSREVAVSMSRNDFKFMMIQEFCPSHEMQKLEFELWKHAMVGAGHAAYTDRFHELAKLVPHLVTPESRMIERGVPRNVNLVNARNPTVRACYECGSTDHVRSACPRLNRAQEPKGNRPNQVAANNGVHGRGNQGNQARGRAFMLGPEEDRQDLNIVMGLEPSDLGFRYEIEIASAHLVEIDKVIKSCKLKIEGHIFGIDLIPFGHGSFDMIIETKEIVVFRRFSEVFPDDLSGLPPIREIEFRIELILEKRDIQSHLSCGHLVIGGSSRNIKELQDKGFIRPSSSPWGALVLFVKKKDGSFRIDDLFDQLQGS